MRWHVVLAGVAVAGTSAAAQAPLIDERSVALDLDSVPAAYGVPPLRAGRMPPRTREIRLSSRGGMAYTPDHVVRIRESGGRVVGEVYEWWPRFPGHPGSAGGPFQLEWRDPRPRGCVDPRATPARWVCRIERTLPVDWRRFLARLDSLGAFGLPAQETRSSASDQNELRVSFRRGAEYHWAYYTGAHPGSAHAGTRAADAISGVLQRVFAPEWRVRPDSAAWSKALSPAPLSIPAWSAFRVRDAGTWARLRKVYPPRGKGAARAGASEVRFDREELVVLASGLQKGPCPIGPRVERVEVRRGVRYVLFDDRPVGWTATPFGPKWHFPCAADPAPVQVVRVARGGAMRLGFDESGILIPEVFPKGLRAGLHSGAAGKREGQGSPE